MVASAFDSAIYNKLFGDREVAGLFSDSAEVRAMLLVEGALAEAQAAHGLIPETSAKAIQRAAMEVQIDPAGLAQETASNAVVVPALVKAFRAQMQAPEHAQYVHWGATSQDIMETGLVLRLRQVLSLYETRLSAAVRMLGQLAQTHADMPMAARTYGQVATPTSFGAVVAAWGNPLIRHLDRLRELKPRLLCVSLSGAAGTLSMMGGKGRAVRRSFAENLGLGDPGESWHASRDRMSEFSAWATMLAASLGKIGEDMTLMAMTGLNEITLPSAGGSSTMPQKRNPVDPSLLVALARHVAALNSEVQAAAIHRQQRDGAAWFSEWLAIPQICIATGRATELAEKLASVRPVPENMLSAIDDGTGLIFAEALSFHLAQTMPRPDAQALVKDFCAEVAKSGESLGRIALSRWPDIPEELFAPASSLGCAPDEARDFAERAKAV